MNTLPANLPKVPTPAEIRKLQSAMLAMPQAVLPVKHHFADGLYARELFRPQGTLIVGKVHAKEHFYLLVEGEIIAWTEEGMKRIKAPHLMITKPGTKRVTLALVDSTCITFHATQETDLNKIEEELIIPESAGVEFSQLPLLEESL